jgi:hypothetical protein
MELDIVAMTIYIFDGLCYPLETWATSVKKVLIRIGQVSLGTNRSFEVQNANEKSIMTLTNDNGDRWKLCGPKVFIKQKDSFNCGPNAILKIMSVFSPISHETPIERLDSGEVRRMTMCNFRSLVNDLKYSQEKGVSVRLPRRPKRNLRPTVEDKQGKRQKETQTSATKPEETVDEVRKTAPKETLSSKTETTEEQVENPVSRSTSSEVTVDEVRETAVTVRTAFRSEQATKMRKQRETDVIQRSAVVGDCVVMEMDKRDVPHARGLLGVVFGVGSGGGALVVTRGGIISHAGKEYFVPLEKYKVIVEGAVGSVLSNELQAVRVTIRTGYFVPDMIVKTSMVAAYRLEYGGTTIASTGCNCKKSCLRHCGCQKKKMACGEGCKCQGQCGNTFNM